MLYFCGNWWFCIWLRLKSFEIKYAPFEVFDLITWTVTTQLVQNWTFLKYLHPYKTGDASISKEYGITHSGKV